MALVDVRHLTKTYPAFRLEDVSFSIEKGRITGFVGRNGAGKSTTIKAMLNLVHPDSGSVSYFGLNLADQEAAIKTRLGYSTGTVNWYPRKKLRDIAAIVKPFYPNWDEDAYGRYLKLFGLDDAKTPLTMSEGMKVKSNLLLALSHRAEVLILDEPTSGLDPFSRDELLDVLVGLKNEGCAVFFSTHIIADLEKCADDIILISEGTIKAVLPKTELMARYATTGESLEETLLKLEKS
ncbi:MAG: ABC transporter ATP-binding protein [Lachnospiraceae bacterium]|nr:ABC transporter ATP-binding protein [Lachnospiraceae bacterium]